MSDDVVSNFVMPDIDEALQARARHECTVLHEAIRQKWLRNAPLVVCGGVDGPTLSTRADEYIQARSYTVARDILVEHLYARILLLEASMSGSSEKPEGSQDAG